MSLAPPSRVILINKLDPGTTPEKLRLKFSPFGPIEACKVENCVGIIEYRRIPDAAEAKRRMQHMSISFGGAAAARPSIGEVRATSATLFAGATTTETLVHAPVPARSAPVTMLCVPEPTHNFLLSPPPSPPPTWHHPEEHDISRVPFVDLEPERELNKTILLRPTNGLPKITVQED